MKLAVKAEWWARLKACYERLRTWLAATAPQLKAAGQLLRRLARQATETPRDHHAHSNSKRSMAFTVLNP